MQEKNNLLSIVKSMDVRASNEKFYRFAQKYIFGMQSRHASDNAEFFEAVMYCSNHAGQEHIRKMMGISGRDTTEIKKWCKHIQNESELKELTLDDLNYIFGYCARLAKIAGNE